MELISAKEALAYLPVSREQLYDLAREQVIPCIRIGKKVLFRRVDIEYISQYGTKESKDELCSAAA